MVVYKEGAEVDMVSVTRGDKNGGTFDAARQHVQAPYLICTWYKASKILYLHYARHDQASAAATALNGKMMHGRKIRALYTKPDIIIKGRILTVTLADLDSATSGSDILDILSPDDWPSKIIPGKASHDLDDEEASRAVQSSFEAIGEIDSWETAKREDAKSKAMVKFRNPADVHEAQQKLHGTLLGELRGSKLFVNLVVSIKYNLRRPVYEILKPKLDEIAIHLWDSDKVRLSSYDEGVRHPQHTTEMIRLHGERPDAVARARAALEPILNGHTATSGARPIWHSFFASGQGLTFITNSWKRNGGFISAMPKQHKLTLHGSKEQITTLEAILGARLQELFALDRQMREARSGRAQSTPEARQDTPQCPVCFGPIDDPVLLPCGHEYCTDCFQQQCAAAPDVGLPVRCHGAKDGTCQQPVANTMLETALPLDAFEELLEGALDTHIRARPNELQHCPTPDCPNVYEVTASDGWVAVCEACLESVCTTCGVIAHAGLTCSEYRDLTSEGTESFMAWKKENGVKDCPKCSTPIEKIEGCNHMTCATCKTHLCWFCMACFASAEETYVHMDAIHRNFYEHDIWNGAEGD